MQLQCILYLAAKFSGGTKMAVIEHFQFYCGKRSYAEHSHLSCEMIFVTEGELEITCDGRKYVAAPEHVCLIPSGAAHSTQTTTPTYSRWLMFVNPWELSRTYFSHEINALLSGLYGRKPYIAKLENGTKVYSDISERLEQRGEFSQAAAISLVTYILSLIGAANIGVHKAELTNASKTVMEVQRYIHDNSALSLKMEEVAERFFTNKYYLTHIFNEYVGMSPKSFQINCRLENAEQQLRTTDKSVSEIAEQCGFVSLSDLTGRFRKSYGVTPAQYRRQ